MTHIPEHELYALSFDGLALTAEGQEHLRQCTACQAQWQSLRQLAGELQTMRKSAVTAQTLQRYTQLFGQVQRAPSLLAQLGDFVRAQLSWDSRQQLAWQGVRGVVPRRLLYEVAEVEIELMIERRKTVFHVEGEVLLNQVNESSSLPVLIEVQAKTDPDLINTLESDAAGHFQFDIPAPGDYVLLFTPAQGASFAIETLEIA